MKKLILNILLAVPIIVIGQNQNVDSLRLEQKYQILFNSDMSIYMPLYAFGEALDPYASPFETDFLNYGNGQITELNSSAINRIKTDMSKTFSIYRKGQNKYYLGVVSDVLGYVGTAAAAGLAVYHVHKYKKKYGIK